MARWQDIVDAEPAFARAVQERLNAHRHKVIATLRRDGSPRVSGIETTFALGDVWIGSMPGARKALDLRRDGRFALHSGSADPPDGGADWEGDAKLSGVAVEVDDADLKQRVAGGGGEPAENVPYFRLDIREAVFVRVGTPADHLVITLWKDGEGLREFRRR